MEEGAKEEGGSKEIMPSLYIFLYVLTTIFINYV